MLRFPAWRDAEADLEHDQDGGAAAHPAGGDRRGGGGAGRPTGQYSTVQYSTVQYGTVQYSTVQYSTVQEEQAGHQAGDMVWPVELSITNLREISHFL